VSAKVVSINAGRIRGFTRNGKAEESAIWKEPLEGAVQVSALGLDGDEHASAGTHGGIDQALYAYSREDYGWWEDQLQTQLSPGTFGENLTTSGIDLSQVVSGERWLIGNVLIEASQPRIPCSTFQYRMQQDNWVTRFNDGGRPGVYFRVIEEGAIQAGERIEVKSRPEASLRVYEMFRIRVFENHRSSELLAANGLSEKWRMWALKASGPLSE
jgi:MOSC domain-containing protein YiiM